MKLNEPSVPCETNLNISWEVIKGHSTTKGQHHTNWDFKTAAILNVSWISLLNILLLYSSARQLYKKNCSELAMVAKLVVHRAVTREVERELDSGQINTQGLFKNN